MINARRLAKNAKKWTRRLWRGLREWSGDAAYDRYLHSPAVRRPDHPPLTRSEFYLDHLQRRYSRPNRCC